MAYLMLIACPLQAAAGELVRIGVFSPMGVAQAQRQWEATAAYLAGQIPGVHFEVVPLGFKELSAALNKGTLDFVVSNPGHYVELEAKYGITRIVTMTRKWQGQAIQDFAGVLVARAGDARIQSLHDLPGLTLAAVDQKAFSFHIVWREIEEAGIRLFRDLIHVKYTGLPHNSPLNSLLAGEADVAALPAGLIEQLAARKKVDIARIKVIAPRSMEGYPFLHSTRLYPQWPFSKTRHTPVELARKVAVALMEMPENHPATRAARIAGWTVPLDYHDIHNMARELRIEPYTRYGKLTAGQFFSQYGHWVLLSLGLFVSAILVLVYVIRLNRRIFHTSQHLEEARNSLEIKVHERTEDLNRANQQLQDEIAEHLKAKDELLDVKNSLSKAQRMARLGNWRWDLERQMVDCSEEFCRLMHGDMESQQISYDALLSKVYPEDRERVEQTHKQMLEGAEDSYKLEYRIMPTGQEVHSVLELGELVRDARGKVVRLVGTLQDITERKRFEARLERAAEIEEVIGSLLEISLGSADMDDFLSRGLTLVSRSTSLLGLKRMGAIFLTDDSGEEPVLRFVTGENCDVTNNRTCAEVVLGRCLCGRAAQEKKLIYAGHVDERHEINDGVHHDHGHYCVPILAEDKVLGVLMLYLHEGHEYDRHETLFLNRVARVLSMGVTRHRAEQEIEFYAYHDTLTSLPNRRLLLDRLNQEQAHAKRNEIFGALLYLDLDNFKHLNDSLGHTVGDQLLLQIADNIVATLRSDDTVARLGGDEFVVMLSSLGSSLDQAVNTAGDMAEKLRAKLSRSYLLEGYEYHATVSIGITIFPREGDGTATNSGADELLKQADSALYEAKRQGRNNIQFYQRSMQEAASARLDLERDIRTALSEDEFFLFYQPQVDAHGSLVGIEALLRWESKKRGFVSPAEFIPVAEESGLIVPLGERVIELACRFIQNLEQVELPASFHALSVNISPKQFHQQNFVEQVLTTLAEHRIEKSRLMLELTEGVLVEDIHDVREKMEHLMVQGIRLSIDDFGTGYSSMAYLKQLPLYELKIDQSFVRDITIDSNDAAIVEAILSMARHLGLSVVAEGVETSEQLDFLLEKGCQAYQGYYFSRPLSAEDFMARYGVS